MSTSGFLSLRSNYTSEKPPRSIATSPREKEGNHADAKTPHSHPAGTPPPTFTLPTLQHIAYIQVMYQNQISALHPPSRGDGTNIDLKSNLDNFYEEPEPLTDAEYDALDARSKSASIRIPSSRLLSLKGERERDAKTGDSLVVEAGEDPDAVYADQAPTFSFHKARAKIFAPDMTLQKLSELMGGNDRLRIVNWKYVARTNGNHIYIPPSPSPSPSLSLSPKPYR